MIPCTEFSFISPVIQATALLYIYEGGGGITEVDTVHCFHIYLFFPEELSERFKSSLSLCVHFADSYCFSRR
jgi:hypothetical protein